MSIKKSICELSVIDEFESKYDSVAKGYSCYIQPSFKNTFDSIYSSNHKSEIEALVEVIYVFLIWRFITLKQLTNGSKT